LHSRRAAARAQALLAAQLVAAARHAGAQERLAAALRDNLAVRARLLAQARRKPDRVHACRRHLGSPRSAAHGWVARALLARALRARAANPWGGRESVLLCAFAPYRTGCDKALQ